MGYVAGVERTQGDKVNAEGALKMLAYNIRRAISVLGVPALMAAVA